MKAVLVTACLACTLTTSPLYAQWLALPTPGLPRTADGKPNLSAPTPRTHEGYPELGGLWNRSGGALGDLENTDKLQPWLQALLRERAENFYKDSPGYQCLPQGPAHHTGAGMKRIIQSASVVAILNDDLTYRQIFTDGRRLESDPNPTWMGYSVGRWEGDTLVVQSNGYNDRTWLIGGYPHTEALRVTERFRRIDFGHLEIAVTFDDPKAYNKPWTLPVSARLAADTEMMEAVCNERPDNGQQHWIGRASDAQKSAVQVAPEVLAKYVGVYKGIYLRNPRTVEITLSGGTLSVSVNGGPKQPIFPQSETNFSGTGLTYQFIRDDHGIATHVLEGHIAGDFKYERQK